MPSISPGADLERDAAQRLGRIGTIAEADLVELDVAA